jgi:alkylated DNA repair dioxygenase AlkB
MQLSFLPESERTLVDDASGRIVYVPHFIDFGESQRAYAILRERVSWRAEKRPMYDRVVDVPRLVAWYNLDDPELPDPIARVRPDVERYCRIVFSRVGLNLYRDGNDSVAPHGDHTEELDPSAPVALLSLGSVRRMTIRSKEVPRRSADLDLEPGSLLVMDYASQLAWNHGVPKSVKLVGPRISLAFRKGPRR